MTPYYDQWLWRVYNQGFPDGHEDSTNTWGNWQIISAEDATRLAADDPERRYEFVPYVPCRPSTVASSDEKALGTVSICGVVVGTFSNFVFTPPESEKSKVSMTDRELLEAAAKAAGIVGNYQHWEDWRGCVSCGIAPNGSSGRDWWNPLTDSGERYELIKTLRLNLDFADQCVWKRTSDRVLIQEFWHEEGDDADPDYGDEAHAVLRAAAKVGKRDDL